MTQTPKLIRDLLNVFETFGIEYQIGGSFASSVWGTPRQTNDLDLAVSLRPALVTPLVEMLRQDYVVEAEQINDALASTAEFRSFQLLHVEELFKVDIFLINSDEYNLTSLRRAKEVDLLRDGSTVLVTSPEDILVTKLRWYLLGNLVSDRQWNDILNVIEMQHGNLDQDYLRRWSDHFGVGTLLEKAFKAASTAE